MHLLAATPGAIEDGTEPVDLSQTPGDIVFISAADTELAALSTARSDIEFTPELRLANLTHLQHPMSVDLHLDDCATKSKLVIARVLGGAGYWKFGLTEYAKRLGALGIPFVALPGDDKPDETLWELSSVPRKDWEALWAYMVEGGPENSDNFLRYAESMLTDTDRPEAAKPLLKAGVYYPGQGIANIAELKSNWKDNAPVVPIVFYRALLQGAGLHPINRLVKALHQQGLNPLPIFVASLKDPLSQGTLQSLFEAAPPSVILNCTSFAVGSPDQGVQNASSANPLILPAAQNAPVFQVVLSGSSEASWIEGLSGLSARDIAMNVSLPEVDGRILTRAVSFKGEAFFDEATQCPIATYQARGDRISFVAQIAKNWSKLRQEETKTKKAAFILANYPNKDGRLANGVGLDTPQATVDMLNVLTKAGFHTKDLPKDSSALMDIITKGPTNWLTDRVKREGGQKLSLECYKDYYKAIPFEAREALETRWGAPQDDPFFKDGFFALSIFEFGNLCVGVQPARGYNIDPKDTYHSPDLIPPHNYLAFYFWLREVYGANALIHMGKHGNLEWLPGKAVSLSDTCWPEITHGATPSIYPFIVNDPGEGTQAKRRISAVIIDHLTPPMARAETYGPLKDLEALVDEYYEAAGVDPRRLDHIRREILSLTASTGIDEDAGFEGKDQDGDLAKLDEYLCDLKESQIRDGLHVFGTAPTGKLERDLTAALVRVPRSKGEDGDASLQRAIAKDLELGIDPLDCSMSHSYEGPRPNCLKAVSTDTWRSNGDTVERIELLVQDILDGDVPKELSTAKHVIKEANVTVRPLVLACGKNEADGLLSALSGQFVAPGASGAPTRGRLDVLPTGRNF